MWLLTKRLWTEKSPQSQEEKKKLRFDDLWHHDREKESEKEKEEQRTEKTCLNTQTSNKNIIVKVSDKNDRAFHEFRTCHLAVGKNDSEIFNMIVSLSIGGPFRIFIYFFILLSFVVFPLLWVWLSLGNFSWEFSIAKFFID